MAFVVGELLLSVEQEEQRKLERVYGTQSRLDLWVHWGPLSVLGVNEAVVVVEATRPERLCRFRP